jgi:ADP-dependent phosphofructokinase/glucokinase
VVPYSNSQAVTLAPLGLTVAFRVAVVCVTVVAVPVTTVGAGMTTTSAGVLRVSFKPLLVPVELVAEIL